MVHSSGFLQLVNEARAHVKELTLDQARQHLTQNPLAVLLDVREDNEWLKGHAVQAVHLGKGIFERALERLYPDPDRELILYCGRGSRPLLVANDAPPHGT